MSDNLLTSPPPQEAVLEGRNFARLWFRWVSRVTQILSGKEPLQLASYTVVGMPDAVKFKRCLIIVTDDVDGEVVAFSDGAVWRRVTDLAEVMA